MVYVYFHKPICRRDFLMTIYSFRWVCFQIWVVNRWLDFSFLIRYVGQSKHGPGYEGNSPTYNIIESAAAATTTAEAATAEAAAAEAAAAAAAAAFAGEQHSLRALKHQPRCLDWPEGPASSNVVYTSENIVSSAG